MLQSLTVRWQLDLIPTRGTAPYPVLVLQAGNEAVHQQLVPILVRSGMTTLNCWDGTMVLAAGYGFRSANDSQCQAV